MDKEQYTKVVTDQGKSVTILVTLIDDIAESELEYLDDISFAGKQWQLSIAGKDHCFTTWTEWFPDPQQALERGMAAILEEGIDEFYQNSDVPNFNQF